MKTWIKTNLNKITLALALTGAIRRLLCNLCIFVLQSTSLD
ncbi:hypothetical protein [Spiroplasma endosymbiont of Colias croceus]